MKIHYIFICILLVFSKSSCKSESEIDNQLKEFKLLEKAKNNSFVYVIPGAGCTGCISEAEKIATEKMNNDSFYFLFTRINSIKLFKLKFPNLFKANNVIIDSQNIYIYTQQKFDIYPRIYLKKENSYVLKEYLKSN